MLSTSHGPGLFELVFEFLNSGSFHLNYVLHLFFISIFSFAPRPWLLPSLVLSLSVPLGSSLPYFKFMSVFSPCSYLTSYFVLIVSCSLYLTFSFSSFVFPSVSSCPFSLVVHSCLQTPNSPSVYIDFTVLSLTLSRVSGQLTPVFSQALYFSCYSFQFPFWKTGQQCEWTARPVLNSVHLRFCTSFLIYTN